jgi:8-oxo-dGTP diphosphatase
MGDKKRMNDKEWRVGVAGVVVHQDRVLLVRHTYGEKRGRWAMPGGFAEHDELLDESVVRELREELGLETEVIDLIGLVTCYTEEGGAVFAVFRLRPVSGRPVPDGVELDRLGWFTADQVAAMTDDELLPDSRNPAQAALRAGPGLREDGQYRLRSDTRRGFLAEWA